MSTVHNLVAAQFKKMSEESEELFMLDIDPLTIWDAYLEGFEPEHNQLFRKRRVHDCATCRAFIKNLGGVVAIVDGKRTSIWDVEVDAEHLPAFEAARALVADLEISHTKRFLFGTTTVGNMSNTEATDSGTLTFEHYHAKVLSKFLLPRGKEVDWHVNTEDQRVQQIQRNVDEISHDAIDTVLELIEGGQVFRLSDFKHFVVKLKELKEAYDAADDKRVWIITTANSISAAYLNIRGTMVGDLLDLLTKGCDLDEAVKVYGSRIENYRAPKGDLITAAQNQQAIDFCEENDLMDSIPRRPAMPSDIGVRDVLYVDQSTRDILIPTPFDNLITAKPKDRVIAEEMDIEDFIKDVLPKATDLEIKFETRLQPRLMSLSAPVNPNAKQLLAWPNNVGWMYTGDMVDTKIAELVSTAGGKTDNVVLRGSLLWNDAVTCTSDLDLHCLEPGGDLNDNQHIHYPYRGRRFPSSGSIDVDIQHPTPGVPAVENIVYDSIPHMKPGVYEYYVHNFTKRTGTEAFVVEFALEGKIYHSINRQPLPNKAMLLVAKVTLHGDGTFTIVDGFDRPMEPVSKEVWGLNTEEYQKVSLMSLSPNQWDDVHEGNKHYFFFMDGCLPTEQLRTIHNEHLISELRPHRKVFAALGAKSKVDPVEGQLSGLGFSSTVRNHATVRFNIGQRPHVLKLNF